jgi:hypothetical protein
MSETTVKSLPAAAYAVAKGARLLRCELSQPGRVDFIFEDPQSNLIATARDFFTGANVSARDYYRALQDVRHAVNNVLGKGGAR